MTFRSKAQRRKFAELLVKGEISEEVYERWNRDTGRKELPERVAKKAKPAKKAGTRKKPAKRTTARAAATSKSKASPKPTPKRKPKPKSTAATKRAPQSEPGAGS